MTSRTTWTHELDNKMLVLILRDSKTKVNHAAIAEQLSTDEHTCTARAVENRLVRLKASVKDDGTGAKGDEDDGNAAPVGKAGKGAKRAASGDDGDGEERRPAAKRGRKATGAKPKRANKRTANDKQEQEEEQQGGDEVEHVPIKAEPASFEDEV